MSILDSLVQALAEGRLEVVYLSAPLSPETPVLMLPPEFGQTATFELEEISRYDDRGPAWYWNNFRTGEHWQYQWPRDGPTAYTESRQEPASVGPRIPVLMGCSRHPSGRTARPLADVDDARRLRQPAPGRRSGVVRARGTGSPGGSGCVTTSE